MSEWWMALSAMERIFVVLAFPFSVLTVIQLILELMGMGGDSGGHDLGVDSLTLETDPGGFFDHFSFFSVRNLIYFLMMFGWTGLACSKLAFPASISIILAIVAGLMTSFLIGWIFYTFSKLTESGNVQISNALGRTATVYIPVPEKRSGTGVIQIILQGITQELNAITDGEKLSTGRSVQVTEVLEGNTVIVIGSDQLAANL